VNLEVDIVVKTLIWDLFSLSTYFSNTRQYIKPPIYADEKFLVVTKCKNSKTEWTEEKK
jgi:hypothetical protein